MSRHRAYCFTINNWTQSDYFGVKYAFNKATYGIVGEEIAPSTGTPHLQGYIHLKDALSMNALAKSMPRAHFLVANGSDEQNKTYCSKGSNIYEVGECSVGQGTRTDIKDLAKLIKDKEITLEDCMFEYPELYVRYSRSLEKMFNAVMTVRKTPPQVYWRWGKAGTGKTRYCIDKHPSHYIKDGTMWWDNYNQQEAVIIDDFDNQIPFRILLRMLDRYDFQGQVKGSYVQLDSPYIYITCEYPPERYWHGNELAQVMRRITSVEEII